MPTHVLTCNCTGGKTFRLWTQDDNLTSAQLLQLRTRMHHHAPGGCCCCHDELVIVDLWPDDVDPTWPTPPKARPPPRPPRPPEPAVVIPDAERRRDPRAVVIAAAAAAAATARRGGDNDSAALEALADLAADHDERRGGHGPRDGRRGNDKRRGGRSRSPLHSRGRSSRSPLQLEKAARPSGCGRRTRSRRRSSCALVCTTTPRPSNQSAEQIDGNNNLLQLILNQLVDMTILLHTQVVSQCRDIAKLLHDDAHHGTADAAAAQLTQLTQFAQQLEAQLNSGATA
jgi:hypothetical protein